MFRPVIATLTLALVAGCGSSMQSIEVDGKKKDIGQLAGKWEGEFAGSANEQAKVAIAMSVNRRDAYKALVQASVADATDAKALRVTYFHVEDREVAGILAPYIDPVCMCTVRTTFSGKIIGDIVRGTFTTHMPSLDKARTGTWRMLRN